MKQARCTAVFATPLGELWMTETTEGVSGLYFQGQKHQPEWIEANKNVVSLWGAEVRRWLDAYFAKSDLPPLPPLHVIEGTAFQRQIWQALMGIPVGLTCTYAQIATRLGRPRALRAVGAAVGRNPLSLLIPCHRVIGASGALTGYAGGLDRKRWLLDHEAALC
jgi:methylated-DNA-[protein]-cysteine S-methyltransferase